MLNRRAFHVFGASFVIVFASVPAAPAAPKSFFLAANPHVPLASVDGRTIRGVGDSCAAADRWGPVGSTWRALDAWGQVVATRAVVKAEVYDVTGCAELEFRGATKADHDVVYVSTSSPWAPSPSRGWAATRAEGAALITLARGLVTGSFRAGTVCSTTLPETALFDVGTPPVHHGVFGGGGGWVVARLDTGVWKPITVHRDPAPQEQCYRPVAVFDMNGDATPEIVLRTNDAPAWSDSVLQRNVAGAWVNVAESPGGGTM